MSKRLVDLDPGFVNSGGEGVSRIAEDGTRYPVPLRVGIGIVFNCPCGCGDRVYIGFSNPISGGGRVGGAAPTWQRTGDTFEDMTLSPSIQRMGGCRWHGWIRNGDAVSV